MITWVKNGNANKRDYDIRIWKTRRNEDALLQFVFWNAAADLLKESRCVRIGVDGNRMYFDIGDKPGRYKVMDYSIGGFFCRIQLQGNEGLAKFEGNYNFKTTEDGMMYIERE